MTDQPRTTAPVDTAPSAVPWVGLDSTRPPKSTAALLTPTVDPDDVPAALRLAERLGRAAPLPGIGRTGELWSILASLAADDVGVARIVEPHLDALAVLAQARSAGLAPDLDRVGADDGATWGVYAAEGPGVRLEARETADGWALDGTKPWCSLAGSLSHALVTAWTDDGRRLFAVGLRGSGVEAADGPWHARGLAQVVSASVRFDGAPAVPVGDAGWYLERPGFAWGGIGVAACWWGGAAGVARAMFAAADRPGREPDQIALAHLGAVDTALHAARTALAAAAVEVDEPTGDPATTARRVRSVVAAAAEDVLTHAAHALGPGPLTTDERFARRCADLGLYLRQHHAERDLASHGRHLLADGAAPW
ncbi:acyl-CoA dehydrogenase [Paraoerskovia sediminicola]|uniref:Acyl-CoA dehydrogenase n=1 Tax=Paraoerskovia sediminicola TaxID=1138587 RepID=A0ABM8G1H2_9CELL|nr:acyl-CoA dehydrogenase [Paraoerskovia sediminicola]BDZ41912.1 acyl-CoA dehydrogenase [Paraoerskovia sediminicola]